MVCSMCRIWMFNKERAWGYITHNATAWSTKAACCKCFGCVLLWVCVHGCVCVFLCLRMICRSACVNVCVCHCACVCLCVWVCLCRVIYRLHRACPVSQHMKGCVLGWTLEALWSPELCAQHLRTRQICLIPQLIQWLYLRSNYMERRRTQRIRVAGEGLSKWVERVRWRARKWVCVWERERDRQTEREREIERKKERKKEREIFKSSNVSLSPDVS